MEKGHLSIVKTIDQYNIEIKHFMDNTLGIPIVRSMSKSCGFSEIDATMIATISSELATNILRYAIKGNMIIKIVVDLNKDGKKGIEIIADDDGPGIPNIDRALTDNYSTTKDSLGMGLPSVYNYMDEFKIQSSRGTGTKIIVRKWCDYKNNRLWV